MPGCNQSMTPTEASARLKPFGLPRPKGRGGWLFKKDMGRSVLVANITGSQTMIGPNHCLPNVISDDAHLPPHVMQNLRLQYLLAG